MRRTSTISVLLAFGCCAAAAQIPPMGLASSSFTDGGIIPDKYTQNAATPVSPALAWTNAPRNTASFALIMHDPDVARHKGTADWLHWAAFNIPASVAALTEGMPISATLPDGTVQPFNDDGHNGFLGPGAEGNVYHHYTFELFALDTRLDLGPAATRADILKAMEGHVLAKAVLEGRFHR